jgi:hypothetical protein
VTRFELYIICLYKAINTGFVREFVRECNKKGPPKKGAKEGRAR